MKIVVIGGTGRIGSKVVSFLQRHGHKAVPASPRLGINTLTGEGLAEAMEGASVVIDVSNSPSLEESSAREFFTTSTQNLLANEQEQGIRHHVALSIVGIDRFPDNAYVKAKLDQEALIESGPIPFTIVRATQFFEYIDGIADFSTVGNVVRIAPVAFQPIAVADVTAQVAQAALGSPLNGGRDIAGPDRLRFNEVVARRLTAQGDTREVVADPQANYFGVVLDELSLVPQNGATLGQIRFEEWLAAN